MQLSFLKSFSSFEAFFRAFYDKLNLSQTSFRFLSGLLFNDSAQSFLFHQASLTHLIPLTQGDTTVVLIPFVHLLSQLFPILFRLEYISVNVHYGFLSVARLLRPLFCVHCAFPSQLAESAEAKSCRIIFTVQWNIFRKRFSKFANMCTGKKEMGNVSGYNN
jgi:hypothetical protein